MTTKKTFGPNDKWPSHKEQRINDAYELARGYGWTLTAQTNHDTFRIACPANECAKIIFSSGKGRESFAKSLKTTIERCPHNVVMMANVTEAETLISDAHRLLDAVEKRLVSLCLFDNLSDRIDADEQSDDLEHFLLAAEEKEREAVAVLEALVPTGDVRGAVDVADDKSASARKSLKDMDRKNHRVKDAWEEMKRVRAQVNRYRKKLE